ncbi:aldolase [Metabacillus sp. DBTR6]|uniref:Aldolase n=1 Tax=Metabacillus rhizolycopersici TaxID=2875709 RepID=A0ABS7UNS9_9BACI|nr:aldolase [Metabacillus rhizolycopersici]MBZ5749684.1 aldolase [Metabacillus rhizolycopersici]
MKTYIANKHRFKAFGLNVLSEIYLPELPQSHFEGDVADILIKKADLSLLWEELAGENKYFVINKDLIMFRLPDMAIYLIQKGNEIYYSPIGNANEDQIRLYLLGTCMGALLMQRMILPLHGSALEIDGKAYAIVGDSGAGKSTLASAFLKLGYQLISDDVIPVTLNEENIPMVTPAYPQQKLWIESLNQFGIESIDYKPIFNRETKFAIPVSNQFASKPLPLAGVFELVKTEDAEIELNPVQKLQRLNTLFNHTYRNFFISPLGLMDWHFSTTAKICEHIDIYQLRRPISRFTAHELTDLILASLNKEEKVYG